MSKPVRFTIPDEDYAQAQASLPGGYKTVNFWARIAFYQIVNKALRRDGKAALGTHTGMGERTQGPQGP